MSKSKDLTNKKFGKLIAIKSTGKDRHGNILWECKCDCGSNEIIIIRAKDLNANKKISCGCIAKENNKIKKQLNLETNLCSVENCDNVHYGLGYCNKHYAEFKRHNKILTTDEKQQQRKRPKPKMNLEKCFYCEELGHYMKKYNKYLCSRHYQQIRRKGEISNTRFDENEVIFMPIQNTACIILYDKKGNKNGEVLVDIDKIEELKKYRWYLNPNKYAETNWDGKRLLLHRLIVNCPNNLQVDHINRCRLDCRIANLRICSKQENNLNTSIRIDSKSQIRGVYQVKAKWVAYIGFNKKKIHIGTFETKEEAIIARKIKEKELFGNFAPTDERDNKDTKGGLIND